MKTTDETTGAPRSDATPTELLPCPFCGAPARGLTWEGEHSVHCSNELCHVAPALDGFGTRKAAVEAWNSRTPVCACETLASERLAFRDEAKRLRNLLERALPVLKHRAVDGSGEAEALVGEVQGALAGAQGAPNSDVVELRAERDRWHTEFDALAEQCRTLQSDVAMLRDALTGIDSTKLSALADWLDWQHGVKNNEVQCDLRRWANAVRDALAATAHYATGRGARAEEGTAP